MNSLAIFIVALIAMALTLGAHAADAPRTALRLPAVLSDHMVLQRQLPVKVWGWAWPGQTVRVIVADRQAAAVAGDDGRWQVILPPLDAGGPYDVLIKTGEEEKVIRDVLVGEVWLCSGQSNMAQALRHTQDAQTAITQAADPLLRWITVGKAMAAVPKSDIQGRWVSSTPESAASFSAIAYHFGRHLRRELGVPVGLVNASWGDTAIQAWMPPTAFDSSTCHLLEPLQSALSEHPDAAADMPPYYQRWRKAMQAWEAQHVPWLQQAREARRQGQPLPPAAMRPVGIGDNCMPTVAYHGMIAPLTPMTMRGVIWSQGESDAFAGQSLQYRRLFPALIHAWRQAFGQPHWPFLYVQLANTRDIRVARQPGDVYALLREAQWYVSRTVPAAAMVVAIDVGDPDEVHYANKAPVGHRLASAALNIAYERDTAWSGPVLQSAAFDDSRCRLRFTHQSGGLVYRSAGSDSSFIIAGEDRQFVPAEASIVGDELLVWSPRVPSPKAVRYGWTDNPACTLTDQAGLPASPFRTDDWPIDLPPDAKSPYLP